MKYKSKAKQFYAYIRRLRCQGSQSEQKKTPQVPRIIDTIDVGTYFLTFVLKTHNKIKVLILKTIIRSTSKLKLFNELSQKNGLVIAVIITTVNCCL